MFFMGGCGVNTTGILLDASLLHSLWCVCVCVCMLEWGCWWGGFMYFFALLLFEMMFKLNIRTHLLREDRKMYVWWRQDDSRLRWTQPDAVKAVIEVTRPSSIFNSLLFLLLLWRVQTFSWSLKQICISYLDFLFLCIWLAKQMVFGFVLGFLRGGGK